MNYFTVCALLLSPALYAMELAQDIELQPLINKHASTYSSIKSMQQGIAHQAKKNMNAIRREAEKYLNVTFPGQSAWIGEGQEGLRFNQLAQSYQSLSPDCQQEVWKHMSDVQKLLHSFAIFMPDIFYNVIIVSMLDGDREAADPFHSIPLVEVFGLYHRIKQDLGDENKPVGPLLRLSPEDRDIVMKVINHDNQALTVPLTDEGKKHLCNVPGDVKDIYLRGRTLQIRDVTPEHMLKGGAKFCCLVYGAGLLLYGVTAGMLLAIGGCTISAFVWDQFFVKGSSIYFLGIVPTAAGVLSLFEGCKSVCDSYEITM